MYIYIYKYGLICIDMFVLRLNWGLAALGGHHHELAFQKSKALLGVVQGVERARVCDLNNPDPERPLTPAWRVSWHQRPKKPQGGSRSIFFHLPFDLGRNLDYPLIFSFWFKGSAAWCGSSPKHHHTDSDWCGCGSKASRADRWCTAQQAWHMKLKSGLFSKNIEKIWIS